MAETLRMMRGVKFADVHPNEVQNYSAHGWTLVDEVAEATLYDVYKLTDGERGKRASKADISLEDAEAYVSERSDNEYEIVEAGK